YAEGQRRYVESLSAYARQFLQLMEKPDVDLIEGLSPAIAIEQKAASHNPRSTVGTVTEIHDYLRLLFARVGTPYCPDHGLARADAKQRLAESLETALRHADGRAIAVETETGHKHLFSAKYACPVPTCEYALPELEPRLFSFNNPMGACPRCDGLGSVEFFDTKRIVAHPNLSLASGAIRGWDRRNHFYYSLLQSLAKHYRFDIEQPWDMLDDRVQKIIL